MTVRGIRAIGEKYMNCPRELVDSQISVRFQLEDAAAAHF